MSNVQASVSVAICAPSVAELLPVVPRGGPIAVRVATMGDLPWMDGLQKQFGRALGYFPTKQFEGYIAGGHVLVAESVASCQLLVASGKKTHGDGSPAPLPATGNQQPATHFAPLGYVISRDRYLKRDELGVIYQLCVAPGHQRGLIGATLVREVFARSAYGCRLYCCWCAQDLDANYFWESLGFVPLAFRVGSGRKKGPGGRPRLHIFWQRRVDRVSGVGDRVSGEDEDTAGASSRTPFCRAGAAGHPETRTPTPYWYPSMTNQGAIREDRLVFPIPPGVRWQEVRPIEVPMRSTGLQPVLGDRGHGLKTRATKETAREAKKAKRLPSPSRAVGPAKPDSATTTISAGGLFFAQGGGGGSEVGGRKGRPTTDHPRPTTHHARPTAAKPKVKVDPALRAKARELRDRWMERVNADMRFLDGPRGKYDVGRALGGGGGTDGRPSVPMLPAA